jgi:hypothetical protein
MTDSRRAAQRGMKFPETAWLNLPDPGDYVGMSFYCKDAPGGSSLVVSDGKKWRVFARNIFTGRKTLTTAMGGLATFSFGEVQFDELPTLIVTLSDPQKLGRLTTFVEVESKTGCSIRVQRGSVLPNTLTSLTGVDPFAGAQTNGVIVNLLAVPNT